MEEKNQPPPYSGPTGQSQQQPYPGQQSQYPGQQPYMGQPGQQQYQGQPGQQQYQGHPGQQPYMGQPGQQPYQGQPGQQPYMAQAVAPQSVVVVTNTSSGTPAPSYLGFAIFTCLCCCWPIGIAAILFAVRTNDENGRGNFAAARSNSKVALWCSVAALIFGSIWLITVIAMAATGSFYTRRNTYYYG